MRPGRRARAVGSHVTFHGQRPAAGSGPTRPRPGYVSGRYDEHAGGPSRGGDSSRGETTEGSLKVCAVGCVGGETRTATAPGTGQRRPGRARARSATGRPARGCIQAAGGARQPCYRLRVRRRHDHHRRRPRSVPACGVPPPSSSYADPADPACTAASRADNVPTSVEAERNAIPPIDRRVMEPNVALTGEGRRLLKAYERGTVWSMRGKLHALRPAGVADQFGRRASLCGCLASPRGRPFATIHPNSCSVCATVAEQRPIAQPLAPRSSWRRCAPISTPLRCSSCEPPGAWIGHSPRVNECSPRSPTRREASFLRPVNGGVASRAGDLPDETSGRVDPARARLAAGPP